MSLSSVVLICSKLMETSGWLFLGYSHSSLDSYLEEQPGLACCLANLSVCSFKLEGSQVYAARFLATFYIFWAPYNVLTQAGIDLFKAYEDKCEAFLGVFSFPSSLLC